MTDENTPILPAVISCSPRPGGNSDRAAELFAQGLAEGGGPKELRIRHLRRYDIQPCMACYRCEYDPERRCFLGEKDQSGPLFQDMLDAPSLFLSAPIFFYHLPAQLKAWVDRSQSFWLRRRDGDEQLLNLPRRKAYVSLIAGRKQGEKLFEGSIITLKYFLRTFNFEMSEPLTLLGLDGPEDLSCDTAAAKSLIQMGREAAQAAKG